MQHCHYKDVYVIPEVITKGPRDHYARFCIQNGKSGKQKCYTVRPNFKTSGEAREAAYKAGRLKVDTMKNETRWNNLTSVLKKLWPSMNKERRSIYTVYYSK